MTNNLSPGIRQALIEFSRNARWGTCVDCPKTTDGTTYPEFCVNTGRYDHQLTFKQLVQSVELDMRDTTHRTRNAGA